MTALALIARVILCVVFALAAGAKLTDLRGTREAIVAFGAPARAAGTLAVAIPLAEIATAVLLLPAGTAVAGAIASLGLLAVFSAAVAVNIARGRAPECHCFGQLHSEPAGPKTLARNAALAVTAVVVIIGGGGPSAVGWIGRLHGSALVAFAAGLAGIVLLVAGGVAFVSLLRSYGRALVRIERLERTLADAGIALDDDVALEVLPAQRGHAPGTAAPAFAVTDVTGAPVSLDDLLAPRLPLMLVFASPHCGPCSALMPEVAEWQRQHGDRLTVAVASDGLAQDVRAEAEELALEHALLDEDSGLYNAFEANGTPSAVLIAADGTVASWIASGGEPIRGLMQSVIDVPGVPVGAPAPLVELESLDGERVTLGEPSATGTLVLFWNPGCGYCRAIHEDVLAWERSAGGGPRLVVVSSGDPERNREDGFRSTVLLDSRFAAGEAFGAGGTPAAILLDADGRVASGVAVGAPAVLALAGDAARAIGLEV